MRGQDDETAEYNKVGTIANCINNFTEDWREQHGSENDNRRNQTGLIGCEAPLDLQKVAERNKRR